MTDPRITDILKARREALKPPPEIAMADWIESAIVLPGGVSALAGKIELTRPIRGIIETLDDPAIREVTIQKSARLGYSTAMFGYLLGRVQLNPLNMIYLLPVRDDCIDVSKTELQKIIEASDLSHLFNEKKTTTLAKHYAGGVLRIIPAKSPRNLRRLTAGVLVADEIDAFDISDEGDAIALGITRTDTYARTRKLVFGSTPTRQPSRICSLYMESDQRIYECKCPDCGEFTEIRFKHIVWDKGKPETAKFACPHCGSLIDHRKKPWMIENGRWRVTNPDRKESAGFRLNALASTIPSADWDKIAAEFLKIKASNDPTLLQPFVNLVLGEEWTGPAPEHDTEKLQSMARPFTIDNLPEDVLWLTMGIDIQTWKADCVLAGWDARGRIWIIEQTEILGSPHEPAFWRAVDNHCSREFDHPKGGLIRISGIAIDSGDGNTSHEVLAFTTPRAGRGIYSIKGAAGNRQALTRTKSASNQLLFIVGVDNLKSRLANLLANLDKTENPGLFFSDTLTARFYEELTAEHRQIRYKKGVPIYEWVRVSTGTPAESLDAVVYSMAIREMVTDDPGKRELELRADHVEKPRSILIHKSPWMDR